MRDRNWKFHLTIALAGMAALNIAVFWKFRDRVAKGYGDFAMFYTAGRILADGQGRRLYDADLQLREQREFAPAVEGRETPLPFNHPPFEGLLFVGLARLPYFTAYGIWTAINLGILLSLPRLLRPCVELLREGSVGVWLPAMLAYFPLGLALLQGQDTVLLLLLLVLAYRALQRNADLQAGCWLALGLFRPQIVLPLVLLVALQRGWRLVSGFAAVGAGLGLVSVMMVGWRAVLQYPEFVRQAERALVDPAAVLRMPNLHGLLATVGPSLGASDCWINGLTAVVSIVLIGVTTRLWSSGRASVFDLGFSMVLVTAVLVSYHAFDYDLTLLLLPMALVADFVFRGGERRSGLSLALLLPIALLLFSPLHFLLGVYETRTSLLALVLIGWLAPLAREVTSTPEAMPPTGE